MNHFRPTESLRSLAQWAKDELTGGNVDASPELATARLQTCEGCEKYLPTTQQCGVCYCFMPKKTRYNNQHCPDGKW